MYQSIQICVTCHWQYRQNGSLPWHTISRDVIHMFVVRLFLSRFMQHAAGIHLPCQRASRQIGYHSWITVIILTRSSKAYAWPPNRLFNDSISTSEDEIGKIIMKCGLENTEEDIILTSFSFRKIPERKPCNFRLVYLEPGRESTPHRPNKSQRI
jgi:hypothetical protein